MSIFKKKEGVKKTYISPKQKTDIRELLFDGEIYTAANIGVLFGEDEKLLEYFITHCAHLENQNTISGVTSQVTTSYEKFENSGNSSKAEETCIKLDNLQDEVAALKDKVDHREGIINSFLGAYHDKPVYRHYFTTDPSIDFRQVAELGIYLRRIKLGQADNEKIGELTLEIDGLKKTIHSKICATNELTHSNEKLFLDNENLTTANTRLEKCCEALEKALSESEAELLKVKRGKKK